MVIVTDCIQRVHLCFVCNSSLFYLNREFAKTIKRPFGVKYNPYTQSVQILKDMKSIASVVNELRHELDIVSDALSKMGKQLEV